MRKLIYAGLCLGALIAPAAAAAADLGTRAYTPETSYSLPSFVWTGMYAGINAGYGTGKFGNGFKDPNGFIGGAQVGYNHQFGQMVAGVEGDLQFASVGSSGSRFLGGSKAEVNTLGTLRGRLGVGFDRALLYGTLGYAFARSQATAFAFGTNDYWHNGVAVGAGIEYAFTNSLTAKAEYLYTNFEKKSFYGGLKAGPEFSIIRAGVNYKF